MLSSILPQFKDFPSLADPWLVFALKVAGLLALIIVPVTNAVHETINQRRARKREDERRDRESAEAMRRMPASILSPMMSAYSDALTIDELRQSMSALSGQIAGLTVLILEIKTAAEAARTAPGPASPASEATEVAAGSSEAAHGPAERRHSA